MSKGALSLSQAETYYDEKYARDDYYTEDRTVAGEWFGRTRRRWVSPARRRGRTSLLSCAA